ncbi:MAG TPA: glucose-inhibited division protein A [Ghiorsea sp.]|nr:glucose-inhibited division protein A [Ghiorsea sp.]HIP07334.1 glucose-inhibited division protein A [Mariprofundaceae bacterium]
MSEQQTLSLALVPKMDYGSWVKHQQAEDASGRLALWLAKGGLLWLSSEEVAGKSHLIHAVFQDSPQVKILPLHRQTLSSVQQLKFWLNVCDHSAYWVLDLPAGRLPVTLGLAVFHLIERARSMHKSLLIVWRCEGADMQPPELSSRLLMMEHVEIAAPQGDQDLQKVLESVLKNMQWDMKETVLPTLLQYVPRKLDALLAAIELLDDYSKKHQKKMNGSLALKVLGAHND